MWIGNSSQFSQRHRHVPFEAEKEKDGEKLRPVLQLAASLRCPQSGVDISVVDDSFEFSTELETLK